MCVNVYLAKREWQKDMLYLHQTGSPHTPLVTWHKLFDQRRCILFSWTTKTMRTFRFSFPFTLTTKANLCVFTLQCRPDSALDFKTWSRHDILNLMPVEHLWYTICKKVFQTWWTFWIRVSEPNFKASKLISIEWLLRQDRRQMLPRLLLPYQVLLFYVMVFFLQTLPRLLLLHRVLLDYVMMVFCKRCQGFCFYIRFSLTMWWCWWGKESGRVMMMLTD